MKVWCPNCGACYEDIYRLKICPHDTFAANDGKNNFAHHPEALLIPPPPELTTINKGGFPQWSGLIFALSLCALVAFLLFQRGH